MPLLPSSVVEEPLRRLCERLVARHFAVELVVEVLCGAPDVRLRVSREDSPDVTVEVLAPDADAWCSHSWDAVRIQHGCRRVWQGPDADRPPEDVAGFVAALLLVAAPQLHDLYVDLG